MTIYLLIFFFWSKLVDFQNIIFHAINSTEKVTQLGKKGKLITLVAQSKIARPFQTIKKGRVVNWPKLTGTTNIQKAMRACDRVTLFSTSSRESAEEIETLFLSSLSLSLSLHAIEAVLL